MYRMVLIAAVLTSVVNAQDYPAGVYPDAKPTPPPAPVGFRSDLPVEATPTPSDEVDRVLDLLPKPELGFVDFGCGADARWCIAAAHKWGCKCVGMEIDPQRATLAVERVKAEGLQHLITIYVGDSTKYSFTNTADVGVAYLYPDTLLKLKTNIQNLKAFASYKHKPPVDAKQDKDTWIYKRPSPEYKQAVGIWNGVAYSGRVCSDPNCGMCNSIQAQIAAAAPQKGHFETRTVKVKMCNGRSCWFVDQEQQVWVPDPN